MNHDSRSRIVEELSAWIRSARPGDRLPSTRALVARFEASPVTVQKALRTLDTRGLIETRPGVGTFVRRHTVTSAADLSWQTGALGSRDRGPTSAMSALESAGHDVFALHNGYPEPDLLPRELVRSALGRVARSADLLRRAPSVGDPDLQAWFAHELTSGAEAGVTAAEPGDVTIVPGSQSGLSSILRSLVGVGRPLVVESPTYWGLMNAAVQTGVRLVPIPSGIDGPDPEILSEAMVRSGASAFYAQPNFATPTGAHWGREVRAEVLRVIREQRAFLIEDDWAHDFGIDARSIPLAGDDPDGHVVYVRSLTKSVSPAIRVGAIIARGPARDRIRADATAESMYVSPILQSAALDVITRPGWGTHLRSLGRKLRQRRNGLVSAIRAHAPQLDVAAVPLGGLNLWVGLPPGTEAGHVVAAARRAGVLVTSGDEWFPTEVPAPYLRLNFAGPNPAGFAEAMIRLGEVLK